MTARDAESVAKHRWKTYGDLWPDDPEWASNTEVDICAADLPEYHNGPVCLACGLAVCHHCHPEIWDEPCPALTDGQDGGCANSI